MTKLRGTKIAKDDRALLTETPLKPLPSQLWPSFSAVNEEESARGYVSLRVSTHFNVAPPLWKSLPGALMRAVSILLSQNITFCQLYEMIATRGICRTYGANTAAPGAPQTILKYSQFGCRPRPTQSLHLIREADTLVTKI